MSENTYDLIIIGAGASGLMSAQEVSATGNRVLVLEGSTGAGTKILMSGGGRCNVTNAVVAERDFASEYPRVVKHVLKHWRPEEVLAFFEKQGVQLKLEESGKYFSIRDRAQDILEGLLTAARNTGVRIEYDRRVLWVRFGDGQFEVSGAGFQYRAPLLLVATGGLSYPATGCDGFGYAVARQFGHTVVPTVPALVPFTTDNVVWTGLQGVSVPCRLTFSVEGKKRVAKEGALLFTHFGFSGPVSLDISRYWAVAGAVENKKLTADFFPALKENEWQEKLSAAAKPVRVVLSELLPSRLVNALMGLAGIDGGKMFANLSRAEKHNLQDRCRRCELPITGILGWDKAEVTAGGVDLHELKGATLESQLQPGLFFAGEVLDVDGRVGGFNLHWAWASGIAAARGAARKLADLQTA